MIYNKEIIASVKDDSVKKEKVASQGAANKSKIAKSKKTKQVAIKSCQIVIEKVTNDDLKAYIEKQNADYKPQFTFNNFIADIRGGKKENSLIADLSNLNIGKAKSNKLFDLRGANFIGSIFCNTRFTRCDLEGAKFCSAHLEQVVFTDSNLNNVDFRKSDLSSCEFSKGYKTPPFDKMKGLVFSSTSSSVHVFADIKNDVAKKNEQERLLHNKKIELSEVKNRTPLVSRIALFLHLADGSHEYKKIRGEFNKMQKGRFYSDNMIHTSFQNVFASKAFVFDPVLVKGESFYLEEKIEKKLVPLNRRDVIKFLEKHKKSKKLSLNEYAKKIYIKALPEGEALDKGVKIIADVSSKVNLFGNNEWHRVNLSGLDFSGTNISEANFSGSNLSKCIFKDAELSYSNFENALMEAVVFENAIAIESNFCNLDFSDSRIINSDFQKARLDWSVAKESIFEGVNLDFARVTNALWTHTSITKCSMNNADFRNVDFRRSKFVELTAKHTIFNKSNFNNSSFSNCCVSNSLFNYVQALHTIWDQTIAKKIEVRYSNYTGCKFSEKCQFENSDFSHSILDGIKAPRAHFAGVKMDYTKIGYGKFAESCFDSASLRFAELDSCVFSESSCKKVDFTGAKIFNILMMKSNLGKSVWNGSELRDSNFTHSNFSDANWKNIYIKDTILEDINNRRIQINDNTEIIDCQFQDLAGQFYHYDEDNFMDIMFIEQLSSNMINIQKAQRLAKWGMLSFILKMTDNEYRIPNKEVRRLNDYRLRNKNELKKYIRELENKESNGINLHKFISINDIAQN